jgi:hypothetical protein
VTEFQPGDRVQRTWDDESRTAGRVNRVDGADLYVTWDGYPWLEDQVTASSVERIEEPA